MSQPKPPAAPGFRDTRAASLPPRRRFPVKTVIALLVLLTLALIGYVAAGPYLAIHGLRNAIATKDTAALDRYVDFPALRANVRAQVQDAIARKIGGGQENFLGALAASAASAVAGGAVDGLVTPAGLRGILEGRTLLQRATGDTVDGDTYGAPRPADPLRSATHRYESLSRFRATATASSGEPIDFIFQRQGIRWRLVDVRLPASYLGG